MFFDAATAEKENRRLCFAKAHKPRVLLLLLLLLLVVVVVVVRIRSTVVVVLMVVARPQHSRMMLCVSSSSSSSSSKRVYVLCFFSSSSSSSTRLKNPKCFSTSYPKPYIHFFVFSFRFLEEAHPSLLLDCCWSLSTQTTTAFARLCSRRRRKKKGRRRKEGREETLPFFCPNRSSSLSTPFRVTSTYIYVNASTSKIGIFEKGKNNRRSHHHAKRVDADVSRPSWRCAG